MIKGKKVKGAHENKTQHTLHGCGKQFSESQGIQKPMWSTHSNGFVSLRSCAEFMDPPTNHCISVISWNLSELGEIK